MSLSSDQLERWDQLFLYIAIVVPWLMGIAAAKGFWSTFFAVIIPPYAWYLTVEYLML